MSATVRGLVCALALCLPLAFAVVPLGERVPIAVRGELKGAYWLVFYSRSCLEPRLLERHWQTLRHSGLDLVAVNPVESGNTALAAPQGVRTTLGPEALKLSRLLKVRSYPTSVLVDAEDTVRAALEGPLEAEKVRETLNLLPTKP